MSSYSFYCATLNFTATNAEVKATDSSKGNILHAIFLNVIIACTVIVLQAVDTLTKKEMRISAERKIFLNIQQLP